MTPTAKVTGRLTRKVTNVFGEDTAKRALFTVACDSYYEDSDGTIKKSTDFIPCTCWGNLATIMATWGSKGRYIFIEGQLQTFQAEPDENGKYPPIRMHVRVNTLQFLDKKPEKVKNPTKTLTTNETLQADIEAMAKSIAQKLPNSISSVL